MKHNRSDDLFLHEVLALFKGGTTSDLVKGESAYQVECPKCHRTCARMKLAERRDTYVLMCPAEDCRFSASLNTLINQYGSEDLKQRWWLESFGPRPEPWLGIKNRRPPGPKKNFQMDRTKTSIPGLASDPVRLQVRAMLEQWKNENGGLG